MFSINAYEYKKKEQQQLEESIINKDFEKYNELLSRKMQ